MSTVACVQAYDITDVDFDHSLRLLLLQHISCYRAYNNVEISYSISGL